MVGCADPDVMPEQTWFERSADGLTATIGCVNADVKWSVRCVDNVWLGYHANCTLGKPHFLTYLLADNATIYTAANHTGGRVHLRPESVRIFVEFFWQTTMNFLLLHIPWGAVYCGL